MEQILGLLLERAAPQLGGSQPLQRVLRAVLERAAARAFGRPADVEVDVPAGTITVRVMRRVVEHPAAPDQIGLAQARSIDRRVELGDALRCAVALDALAPYLEGALVVPVEQYAPLRSLLTDLMWDREVLAPVPRRAQPPRAAIERLVGALRREPFASWVRPGCDSVELEAHEMMMGRVLPRALRELLGGVGGMEDGPRAPRLRLGGEGYRLLSPGEAQRQHAEWTRHRDQPRLAHAPLHPATVWDTNWLPLAVASREAGPTGLLVVDPVGSAGRPGELLCVSFQEAGWWRLGVDLVGLAHVWHTLALHDLLEHGAPEQDAVDAAKATALVQHLLPEHRWVDAG